MLWESGFVQDQESRAALEDIEAAGYQDLVVSEEKESDVEDINSDLEVDEVVEALEEGWDGDN